MNIDRVIAYLQSLRQVVGNVEVGVADPNMQALLPVRSITFVEEHNQVVIFLDEEP